jgi:hypothetical protein
MRLEREGEAMTKQERRQEIDRQRAADPSCRYCGKPRARTVDHVIPTSQGGADHPSNIVLCCEGCNRCKDGRTPIQWALDILTSCPQLFESRPVWAIVDGVYSTLIMTSEREARERADEYNASIPIDCVPVTVERMTAVLLPKGGAA